MTDAARSIALSLFREARATNQLEPVADDLARLAGIVSDPDVRRFLSYPRIPLAEKERVLSPAVTNDLMRRLLAALLSTRESELITALNESYSALVRRETGFVDAAARVAQPLTPAQDEAIRTAVKAATGLTAVLKVYVDPGLIGGVRLTIDGRVADNSLKSRLERLKESLQAI